MAYSGDGGPYHPVAQSLRQTWERLADCVEGLGGFLDGAYIAAHPREWLDHSLRSVETDADGLARSVTRPNPSPKIPSPKLTARRKLARYENLALSLLETKHGALFSRPPMRQIKGETVGSASGAKHPLIDWWQDVDGLGTAVDDWMAEAWRPAATYGHVVILIDRDSTPAPTFADASAPRLRLYSPLDVPCWWVDEAGDLVAVDLLEPILPAIGDPLDNIQTQRRRVERDQWSILTPASTARGAVTGSAASAPASGPLGLGALPVVYLFARRRPLLAHVGQSDVGDPQCFIDLYNLTSEVRELLRAQTFGLLNVPLGVQTTGGGVAISVEEARNLMGSSIGTDNVLFTPLAAEFLSPSGENLARYYEERQYLLRTLFRLADVPYETDSRDAEAAAALRVKRDALTQMLSARADECERTEYALVDRWYRMTYGPDAGPKRMEADQVVIRYPDTFDVDPFETLLQQAQAAITLEYPAVVRAAIQKRLLPWFLPDMSAKEAAEVDQAIDAHAEQVDEAAQAALDAELTPDDDADDVKPERASDAE